MMKVSQTTPARIAILFASLGPLLVCGAGVRGSRSLLETPLDDGSQNIENITFCVHTNEFAENNKYFWLTMLKDKTDSNGTDYADIKGSCLVTVPNQTASDTERCCTVPGTTQYNTDYDFVVADPITVLNRTSPAYKACGNQGGMLCPDYSYSANEQGFTYFHIKDSNGSLKKPNDFVCKDSCDGLTHSSGNYCGGYEVYEHVHVGKGYCDQAAMPISEKCDGNFGYTCSNDATFYHNMSLCVRPHSVVENDKWFWLSVISKAEDGNQPYAGCLLHLPLGADSNSNQCCAVGDAYIPSSNDYSLQVTDPSAVTNTTGIKGAYDLCGGGGTSRCPSYNFADNQQTFQFFRLSNQNGDEIKKMDSFSQVSSTCGLGDENGSCDDYPQYEHVSVGKSGCLDSVIKFQNGCSKYHCLDEDC